MLRLAAWLLIVPMLLAVGSYAMTWAVLCLVRIVPMIGRKHRHPDWERLNKQ
jgi:hypothetical protein